MGKHTEKEKNFISRVQRNPFMRKSVLNRLKGLCWFCHKKIDDSDFVLHHLTYDYECQYITTIKISAPTLKYPNKLRKVPDCEACYKQNPRVFYACELRLVAVHDGCHFLIHRDEIFSKRKI